MAEEVKNASDMIQDFLGRQSIPVNVSVLRKALPFSFTVLIMALDQLDREGKLSFRKSGESLSCGILLRSSVNR